ncbi:MAG: CarD family transcriptional regulator [bacterium]
MFKVGDNVVYPAHGVAVIEEVVEKKVLGMSIKFFKLRLLFKETKILVPIKNIETAGIRYLSTHKELETFLKELYKPPTKKLIGLDITPSGWNRRNKEYQMKIQDGLLIEMLQIYRDLMHTSYEKELSFGERNILHLTEELISEEIQQVKKCDKDIVLQELRMPFKQFFFHDHKNLKLVSSSST